MATVASFVGLAVTNYVPVINLVNWVPMFKEAVIGAVIVAVLSNIPRATQGAKFGVVSGMTAAVAFSSISLLLSMVIAGWGATNGDSATASAAALMGLGWLANLFGLLFFSPVGFAVGGALGTLVNGGEENDY